MSTRWTRAARLRAVEFDACWELLELGETPIVLELPSPGRDNAERRRLLAAVLAELRRRGLADRDGPLPPLAGALRLLARPEYELDIRLAGANGATIGLGAVAGTHGVIVARHGDQLAVLGADPVQVIPALIELAGPMSPGTARPVTLAADVFDHALTAAAADPTAFADELRTRGVHRTDATSTAHLFRDVRAVGQLGATGRIRGAPQRAPWVIGFHQTGTGHFLQLRRPDPAGPGTSLTLCPTDAARLAAHATDMVAHVYAP